MIGGRRARTDVVKTADGSWSNRVREAHGGSIGFRRCAVLRGGLVSQRPQLDNLARQVTLGADAASPAGTVGRKPRQHRGQ